MDIEARLRDLYAKKTSRYRAAELLGVNRYSLDAMIDSLGLDWPIGVSRLVTLDGIEMTVREHAARLGVKVNTLRWRIRQKIPPAGPTQPPGPEDARKFTELRGQGLSAWKAAAQTGFSYDAIRRAAKRHCPEYDEVVKNAKRARRRRDEMEGS